MHRQVLLRHVCCVFATGLVLVACSQQANTPAQGAAQLVLKNAAVYTVDGARSWAEALAISEQRFSYVGSNAGAEPYIGPDTIVLDLGGRMVLPGMFDVHIHPVSSGMDALACDLTRVVTLELYLETIAQCAANHPGDGWITGSGWLMSVFGPGARASRTLLDDIVPDRPVYLESADGHTAWVNSKALELAGITADTQDPPNGLIDREPGSLQPFGSLQEHATSLVEDVIPAPGLETRVAGLRYAVRMLNDYGITSIQAARAYDPYLEAYAALLDRDELTLRVVAAQNWNGNADIGQLAHLRQQRERFNHGNLRATSVKIWLDGVMENFTAAMLEPYVGQGTQRGMLMVQPDALNEIVTELDAAGFQVHFHAIGDRAVRVALDAVEIARSANGQRDNRHHISHLEVIDPADIARFRKLNVVANFTAYWAYADLYITDLTLPYISAERSRWLYPMSSIFEAGGTLAFGSDWSVSSANPFLQIETAMTRKDPLDAASTVLVSEELLPLPEAIAALTINGAYVNRSENETGSIEVGKLADLAVLDQNLFDVDPSAISDTQVLLTLLGGTAVHGNLADFAAPR